MWAALRGTPSRSWWFSGQRLLCGNWTSQTWKQEYAAPAWKRKWGRPMAAKQGKISWFIKLACYWQESPHAQSEGWTQTITNTMGILICYAKMLAQMACTTLDLKRKPVPLFPGNKVRARQFAASLVSLVNKNIYKMCRRKSLLCFVFLFVVFVGACSPLVFKLFCFWTWFACFAFLFVCFSSRVYPQTTEKNMKLQHYKKKSCFD